MVNISSLHLLLFQSSSDKDLGIHLFVGSHRHLVDTAKADHLGNKVARFTNGQCTRFSFLRPMFDPYDRLWLYVKEYIGHPLGHMGFQRAPKPPPKLMTHSRYHPCQRKIICFTYDVSVPCSPCP